MIDVLIILIVFAAIFIFWFTRYWPKHRIKYLRKYAGRGSYMAQCRLAEAYATGFGVEQDFEQAAYWDSKAKNRIGQPYDPALYAQTVAWVSNEAKNGSVDAQYTLGLMYLYGDGVPQNATQAVSWFKKAAIQGDADGQWSLGLLYYRGKNVQQDVGEAAIWIKKAADQGHAKAHEFIKATDLMAAGSMVSKKTRVAAKKTRAAAGGPLTPSRQRILFLILMSLLLITGALLFNAPKGTEIIEVRFPGGARLQAEVAETPEKLLFGLAFRETLPADHGMIFLFEESGLHKVWTKQYQFNVDLIWVNESKHVVHIVETAIPCLKEPCEWYGPPPERARYLIAANSGFVDRTQVALEQELVFALRL